MHISLIFHGLWSIFFWVSLLKWQRYVLYFPTPVWILIVYQLFMCVISNRRSYSNLRKAPCRRILFIISNMGRKIHPCQNLTLHLTRHCSFIKWNLNCPHIFQWPKGQLISRELLVSSISSKKRTNQFVFLASQYWKRICSFVFSDL